MSSQVYMRIKPSSFTLCAGLFLAVVVRLAFRGSVQKLQTTGNSSNRPYMYSQVVFKRRRKLRLGEDGTSKKQLGLPLSIAYQPVYFNTTTQKISRPPQRTDVGWKLNESLACKDENLTSALLLGGLRCYYKQRSVRDLNEWSIATYAVNFGVAGAGSGLGENGRNFPNAAYLGFLRQSRIVITCQPMPWEGDWRLAEAMASGALVIANHMVDPAPGIQNGVNLVLYNNTEQMMQLLHWYLDHPAAADRIAAAGRLLAWQWTPQAMVERMLKTIVGSKINFTPKVFIYRFLDKCLNAETQIVLEGFSKTSNAIVVDRIEHADLFVLDVHRLNNCKDMADDAKEMLKRAVELKLTTIALDFHDRPYKLASVDSRFIFYFKRSRVCRLSQTFVDHKQRSKDQLHPIYYPLKTMWATGLKEILPRSQRTLDLSYFFPLFRH